MQISGFRTCYCVIIDIAYAVCYNSANINGIYEARIK